MIAIGIVVGFQYQNMFFIVNCTFIIEALFFAFLFKALKFQTNCPILSNVQQVLSKN